MKINTIGRIILKDGKLVFERFGAAVAQKIKLGTAAFADIVKSTSVTEEGSVPDAILVAQQQQLIGQQQETIANLQQQVNSLNSAIDLAKLKCEAYIVENVNITKNNYILHNVNFDFSILFVTITGISGTITNVPCVYGRYNYIIVAAPNGTAYKNLQLLLWHH